ncbi:MAG: NAD-dependent epimerase/dehydratase family protein [Nitrososphaeria archaeon]|nr:NAD-dependent epimerase/dehydratase family protein [Nitrososphaeria archaeon]NDB90622.1 NAD-dependent epimerase/dehydratase family protein [Nitrososphaerota archaeon]NDF25306.1 NAD-dependent epimerase/dehydratase family protein [Nitrososphaerota archaeon]NDF48388.1 NAD-dependent epimerase/dehydratase family protein [Nitrosopumilaceae archaeon]
MKIMITGGAGFIGSHLCDEFVGKNDQVIVLTRASTALDRISHLLDKIILERVDVTNYDDLGKIIEKHRPDVIIHLAGETSHSKSFENPLYDLDVNTKSTLFILEKIKQLGLKCRFVLGSTFIVVGKPLALPVNEESICNPTTIYGANRLASEVYCKIYNNVFGLDTVSFRITNSFGPREQYIPNKNAVNFLIYKAFRGEEVTIFDKGNFFRDLVYVDDVVSAIKVITQKGTSGELYWISSGNKMWFYDLGKWLEELTQAKVKYVKSPQYTKKVDVGNFVVDNSKLRLLGWEIKTPIKDGIKKTLAYFETLK